jgi:hypothetical protein
MQVSKATNWTEEQIRAAWNRGQLADRLNPDKWRKDACGAWIAWQQFGNKESAFGWDIDRDVPLPGAADSDSLQPLQWMNAEAKRVGAPACRVIAYGGDNVTVR